VETGTSLVATSHHRLRIAQVAPLYEDVPPTGYGGTERVIAGLCDGLVADGHDVTLFATGGSRTSARLVPTIEVPLRKRMNAEEMADVAPHLHLRMLSEVYARAEEFDVIHAHTDVWTLPFTGSSNTPTVLTMHGRLDVAMAQRTLPLYPGAALVSISDHQRIALDGCPVDWLATIPNGLDLQAYHAAQRGGANYLAFVGRICPEKRPDIAVEVAARTGWPLRVAAKVDPTDRDYFEDQIAPLFEAHDVDFVGELCEADKPAFYAGAAATLFPSDWPEPFGLVMIESLAAGTPVIALRRGSVPEVLVDNVCGFICDDSDDMVCAVERLSELHSSACRRRAIDFGVDTMCQRYQRAYDTLLERAHTGVVTRSLTTGPRAAETRHRGVHRPSRDLVQTASRN
jgi:glycosyltransferase involved in cell wall biosynthesis